MTKRHVLVVEDEKIIALDIRNSLTRLGYIVPAVTASGEEAINTAQTTRPDLVLMDIKLKGDMDGVEAAEHIRNRFNIPIIYLTANADDSTLQRAKITEPYGYILKPFEERELQTTIELALHKHKVESELKQWVATTLRSIGEAVITVDRDGLITFMNPAAERLTGWEDHNAMGKPVASVLHIVNSDGLDVTDTSVTRAMNQPEVIDLAYDYIITTRSGSDIPIDATVAPIQDRAGIAGVVFVCHDVTERKRAEEELRKLSQAVEHSPAAVLIYCPDGNIEYVNAKFTQMTGFTTDEIIGTHVSALGHNTPAEAQRIWETISSGNEWRGEFRSRRKDGESYWVSSSISPIKDARGTITHFVEVHEDITDRRRAAEALRQSEERYALAAQGANDGLWDWDLTHNTMYFSPRWKSMLGHGLSEIGHSPNEWFDRIHPDDLEQVQEEIAAHLQGITSHFESEHRMRHKDGTYCWMLCRGLAVRDEQGVAYRMAGSQSDITDRKRAEQQLVYDAFHDALTGLPNRALFMDRLERAIERSKRNRDHMFGVLFLDLDRFKIVNDSLGHTNGDQLLIAIAPRLQACLRAADTVARLGGDEFSILLEAIKKGSDAEHVAERIRELLTLPFCLNGHEIFVTASIGIVLSTTGYDRPEDVLRDADIAMYRAKALGKTRYVVFNTAMRDRAAALLDLETDLRHALERQEFLIQYQPIVSLESSRITGFEALLRWHHPNRGMIPPSDFIPIAEETELIVPIGRWVLREACQQMRKWQSRFSIEPPLTISVNLSRKQFSDPKLTEQIEAILQQTGLDASSLKLEITESAIMDNAESATAMLSKLKVLGIQVQMDDFGTGYSSLSYLHQFPIDTIKIDRSFINRIEDTFNNSEIVRTIVTLAHNLTINVIAEGVETQTQLHYVKSLNCEYGQGYFISRPLDYAAAEALIADIIARKPAI